MDKRGVREDGADDGEERARDGGGEPRDGRLGREAEVRGDDDDFNDDDNDAMIMMMIGPEAAQHPADGAEALA